MENTQQVGTVYQEISALHNEYRSLLGEHLPKDQEKSLTLTERIDRVAFHVIEEIIEMRRTYPHKFWRKAEENTDTKAMVEETVDVFLMMRSMILEVCKAAGITEEQFLTQVINKVNTNIERVQNGY